jgi:hypothetical protein
MAIRQRRTKTADAVCLDVLAYEFESDDRTEAEKKIKRRLRYHGVGPYRQTRVDLLRRLKDEVRGEIERYERSRYFAGFHGGGYAAMEDFDIERMTRDLSASYPDVARDEIAAFVPSAVYLYYMR